MPPRKTPKQLTEEWIKAASADELRSAILAICAVNIAAWALFYQYSTDPDDFIAKYPFAASPEGAENDRNLPR